MKKILLQCSLLLITLTGMLVQVNAQKKIKEGYVKFTMEADGDSEMMSMLGGTNVDFYFSGKMQRMDMNMMGGMMRVQTIMNVDDLKNAAILMDMMGMKYHITDLSEDDLSNSNSFMNMDLVENVIYDEKDTKEIAGYPCYKALIKMKNGMELSYYITEKIQPPVGVKSRETVKLKGYPLQMAVEVMEGMSMTFKATEVFDKLPKDAFAIPAGYTKKTMKEFQEEMGGLNFGK